MSRHEATVRISGPLEPLEPRSLAERLRVWTPSLSVEALSRARWFGDKGRRVEGLALRDACVLRATIPAAVLALVEVRFAGGDRALYQMPWTIARQSHATARGSGESASLRIQAADGVFYLSDSEPADPLWGEILRALRDGAVTPGGEGRFHFELSGAGVDDLDDLEEALSRALPARELAGERSHEVVVYGDLFLYKLYRRLVPGPHPELELSLHLSTSGASRFVPRVRGWLEYRAASEERYALGLLRDFVPGGTEAWGLLLTELRVSPTTGAAADLPSRLGELTATLHGALAGAESEALRSEPFDEDALRRLEDSILRLAGSVGDSGLPASAAGCRDGAALGSGDELVEKVRLFVAAARPATVDGQSIRVHGDYHLGQVLCAGDELFVVDFEGEPARPVEERRAKQSPLKDVAGMLRSFSYVASLAASDEGPSDPESPAVADGGLRRWEEEARRDFLARYWAAMDRAPGSATTLPSRAARRQLLALFELEKALYEVLYELRHRPGTLWIPLRGLERILRRTR